MQVIHVVCETVDFVYLSCHLLYRYMLAAISPAVLVPNLLNIQTKKPPNADDRGLPTMLIVSAAFDDVICIALFGMFLGLAFSQGTHLALSIARGPIEVVLGLVYGVVVGVALWYLPSTDTVSVCVHWQS